MGDVVELSESYRGDPKIPPFDESRPLFLFDGICVLCSTGVSFLMRHDRRGKIALASAQSPLGRALYAHYGLKIDASYLMVADGRAYAKTDGFIRVGKELGGIWRAADLLRLIPRPLRDWLYDRLAANRYRLFGKSSYCGLLTPDQRARLIDR
ncbi:MAG TPA: DCC1-like thiol-disulfide oxidoreductase family protein [Sphingomicrobium sp.]|nr:DCC1-like thiol-disulfide oxidoreductase family protein [Sphingomicrobium sp.]